MKLGKTKRFPIGFFSADRNRKNKQKRTLFFLKNKITLSGLNFSVQSLGLKTCIGMSDQKFNVFHLNTVKIMNDEKVHEIINRGK